MKVNNHTSQYRHKLTIVLGQVSHYLMALSLFLSVHLIIASALVIVVQKSWKTTGLSLPPQLVAPFPLLIVKHLFDPMTIRLGISLLFVDLVGVVIWLLKTKKEISQ